MPVKITKTKRGYQVKTPNQVHAKHTTKEKAEKQARLRKSVKAAGGWVSKQYRDQWLNMKNR